jgi:hypothetical protein
MIQFKVKAITITKGIENMDKWNRINLKMYNGAREKLNILATINQTTTTDLINRICQDYIKANEDVIARYEALKSEMK